MNPTQTPATTEVPKRPRVVKDSSYEHGIVAMQFANGTTRTYDANRLPAEIRERLIGHGLKQKVSDSFAGAKGNIAEAIASADEVYNRLLANDWIGERGGDGVNTNVVCEAIAEMQGKDLATVRAKFDTFDKTKKVAIAQRPDVVAKIAEIRLRKAQAAAAAATVTEALDEF